MHWHHKCQLHSPATSCWRRLRIAIGNFQRCRHTISVDIRRRIVPNSRVPWQVEQQAKMTTSEIAVTARPVVNDRRTDVPMPGHAASSRHGSSENVVPPSAGIRPKEGKTVPIRPAATGVRKRVRVSAGIQRSIGPHASPIGRSAATRTSRFASSRTDVVPEALHPTYRAVGLRRRAAGFRTSYGRAHSADPSPRRCHRPRSEGSVSG